MHHGTLTFRGNKYMSKNTEIGSQEVLQKTYARKTQRGGGGKPFLILIRKKIFRLPRLSPACGAPGRSRNALIRENKNRHPGKI
jgi:hypothetical protein